MYEQALLETKEGRKENEEDKERISIYEALQVLIEHGHDKDKILNTYSREELTIFYEKCSRLDTLKDARFIETVMAGIGGAFGGGKEVTKLLKAMRK
jgi:hypothetical protein